MWSTSSTCLTDSCWIQFLMEGFWSFSCHVGWPTSLHLLPYWLVIVFSHCFVSGSGCRFGGDRILALLWKILKSSMSLRVVFPQMVNLKIWMKVAQCVYWNCWVLSCNTWSFERPSALSLFLIWRTVSSLNLVQTVHRTILRFWIERQVNF